MDTRILDEIFEKYKTEQFSLDVLAEKYSVPYTSLRRKLENFYKDDYKTVAKILIDKRYEKKKLICLNCNSEVISKNKKFCSKSCSASYTNRQKPPRSEEQKDKISIGMKKHLASLSTEKYIERYAKAAATTKQKRKVYNLNKICKNCKVSFTITNAKSIYRVSCSPECSLILSTLRKEHTLYTKSDNTVVRLESSWEVNLAKWLDKNYIDWIRPKYISWKSSDGKNRKYFPDFYLPKYNVYLDPKNDYRVSTSQEKLTEVCKLITLYYGRVESIKEKVEILANCR